MDFQIESNTLLTLFLISVRVSVLFLFSPVFSFGQVPHQVRYLFAYSLAFFLFVSLGIQPVSSPNQLSGVLDLILFEFFIGFMLAFGVLVAFSAYLFGGRILDMQMGFAVASLVDPVTKNQNPLIGTLLYSVGIVTFLALDGHHQLIRGLAYSFSKMPPGSGFEQLTLSPLIQYAGIMFFHGVMMVIPVIISLLLVDFLMAYMARTMPQVNMFIMSLPIKILLGIFVLMISLSYISPVLSKNYQSLFLFWQQLLQ
ncbi:MAG: flagellar biosynthetic protein FliR [Gammaproteobacteria bacterium]|nr:flagellar biosynthetic protein FliR [Gammaproteobacteria bacterium]MDH5731153.1 flagellar biosynthetic protein FliR [Gammaproteobacteria bacterium]